MSNSNGIQVHPVSNGRRRTRARLRLTNSERKLLLVVLDVLSLNVALLATLALRLDYRFSLSTFTQVPLYFILLSLLWSFWGPLLDCYEPSRSADVSQSAWSTGGAALLSALCYLIIPYYTPPFPGSRLSTLIFASFVTVSVPAWRVVYAKVFSQPTFQQRLLIVGAGRSGRELARVLAKTPKTGNPYAGSGFLVVGFVDDNPDLLNEEIEGFRVIGSRYDLLHLAQEQEVDILVLSITYAIDIQPELFQALLDCREQGIRIEPMTSLYERLTGRVPVEHAGNNLHVVLPLSNSPVQRIFGMVKRVIDIFVGVAGLIVLGFITLWVALVNAICCPGPLFYRQARIGKGGKTFQLLKFRSMIPDAEKESGAVWAEENDNRVTPVGRLLRATRLDEFPQIINVLKGEMSLVGPRPERPEFVADLIKHVPFYQARHAVRPGITGWAQVRYQYGSSIQDALIKLQYDLYYIKHQGVYLELSILAKTAGVILGLRGR